MSCIDFFDHYIIFILDTLVLFIQRFSYFDVINKEKKV